MTSERVGGVSSVASLLREGSGKVTGVRVSGVSSVAVVLREGSGKVTSVRVGGVSSSVVGVKLLSLVWIVHLVLFSPSSCWFFVGVIFPSCY